MSSEQKSLGELSETNTSEDTEFEKIKVEELGEIVTGSTPSTKQDEFYGGDIPFIKVSDLDNSHPFVEKTDKTLTKEGAEDVANRELEEGAIMVTCIGSIGKNGITTERCFTNQQINSIVPSEEYDPWYIYYKIETLSEKLEGYSGGSAHSILSKTDFSNMEVEIHKNKEERNKIGEILSDFDRKMRLNRRVNEILEELAQALFKSWFIDFEPYEDFKDSELGEIPEDFEVKTLSDIAEIEMGSSPKSEYYNEEGNGLPFFQGKKNFGETYPRVERWCSKPKKIGEEDDIIMTVRAPVGDINRLQQKSCVGRGVAAFRSENFDSNDYLYYLLKARESRWEQFASGTTYDSVNSTDVKEFPVVYPPISEVERFLDIILPFTEIIKANFYENKNLRQLRDNLLPKLMSGEIRVNVNGDE